MGDGPATPRLAYVGMIDESAGWRLELNQAVVAELVPGSDGGWYVTGIGGPPSGPFSTIQVAVNDVPVLRATPGPGHWALTTSVPTSTAAFMLDEPGEEVGGVTINGEWCETYNDGVHRFLLTADCLESEWDELLTVATKSPGSGSPGGSPAAWWTATRYGPVCEFWVSEELFDDRFIIKEASDLGACERLLGMVEGYVTQLSGPVADHGTPEDNARLVAAVNSSYGGVLWVAGNLWVDNHLAPTGLLARLPTTGPLRLYRDDDTTCLSGDLTASDQNLPEGERWIAVVCDDADHAASMLAADFASTNDEDGGDREQVIVENGPDTLFLGHIIEGGLERAELYGGAFGGVILQGAGTVVEELSIGARFGRRWSWASQPGSWPDELARQLPVLLE